MCVGSLCYIILWRAGAVGNVGPGVSWSHGAVLLRTTTETRLTHYDSEIF